MMKKERHGRNRAVVIAGLTAMGLMLPVAACGGGQASSSTPTQPTNPPPVISPSTAYFVNCAAASNGSGTQTNPWNSLTTPNAVTFQPGDQLLFMRGTTCSGMLSPNGSGTSAAPITIDAYGTGTLPLLDGGASNQNTIELNGVQYYNVQNLAVRGSNYAAIQAFGPTANTTYEHIHFSNLDVSAVNHVATKRGDGGGILFGVAGKGSSFDDVLIDGVTVHDMTAAQGIDIEGYYNAFTPGYNTNVTVQNSTVHDVYADGILLGEANGALMQNNVVYRSGMCANCTGSTPVGLWNWFSKSVTARNNESYANQTWAAANTDGGDFDIDMWNQDTTYEYNYGHDSQGYCFLIEGYDNVASDTVVPSTSNTVVRYNICANNISHDTGTGEILIFNYGNGLLNGVQVYNNTIYLSGVQGSYAIMQSNYFDPTSFTGTTPNFIKNNLIYSTQPYMVNISGPMTLDHNLYWNSAGTGYLFTYSGTSYTKITDYQTGSEQDANAVNADPMLNGAGYHSAGSPTLTSGYYTLKLGSPALGTGANVCTSAGGCITGSMGTVEFFGQTLSTSHNIGAFD